MLLSALIAANLALDFTLCSLNATLDSQIILSITFGQVLLLGAWLSLGVGKWYRRLVFTVACVALIGASVKLGLGKDLDRIQGSFLSGETPESFGLILVVLLFVVTILLLPLRRFRGWLLTSDAAAAPTASIRFQLRDVLVWMVAIAAALGVARSTAAEHIDGIGRGTKIVVILAMLFPGIMAPVQWPALLTAFTEQRRLRWLIVLAMWTCVYGCGLVALFDYQQPWRSLAYFLRQVSETFQLLGAAVLGVLLNGLAVRAMGWRLVRPLLRRSIGNRHAVNANAGGELSKLGRLPA